MADIPAGTTRAAVVIGVDRTGNLQPLAAATKGALEMETWLKAEGYHVIALTDKEVDGKPGKVRFADIFDAVELCVKCPTLTSLVIYFAGHGYYSVGSEIWLLSGAPGNPNEAVNLAESAIAARASGLQNVVFIADTCRSIPQGIQGNAVRGGSIFTNEKPQADTLIDFFYATLPGDVAVEVAMDAERKNYDGLFTLALRELHAAAPEDDVCEIEQAGAKIIVLPNRKLRIRLPEYFALKVKNLGALISQKPALRIESDEPFHIACAKIAPAVAGRGDSIFKTIGVEAFALDAAPPKTLDQAASELMTRGAIPPEPVVRLPGDDAAGIKLAREARTQRAAAPEVGFETQCGVAVSGSSIVEAFPLGGIGGEIEGQGQPDNKYRIMNDAADYEPCKKHGSVVLRFTEGTGTIVAAIPGYIAALIVTNGAVISVTYSPAPNSQAWQYYEYSREQAEQKRAIVATAARHGILAMDRDEARKFADVVRVDKSNDPTLGIYAALAYSNVGLRQDALSVLHFMQNDLDANLFDVWLFAGADKAEEAKKPLVPVCPMLSQGWDYLRPLGVGVPGELDSKARLQSLWTTFTAKAMDEIMASAHEGKLDR